MKYLSILFTIVVIIVALEPQITFKPFTFKLNGWYNTLSWLFIIIGVLMLQGKEYRRGLIKGTTETIQSIHKDYDIKKKTNTKEL